MGSNNREPSWAAIERGTDDWVQQRRLTWSERTPIVGGNLQAGLAAEQEVFCYFSLVSSYKANSCGGFLARVDVQILEFGVQGSLKEESVRGYYVDQLILFIDPGDDSACQGIVRYSPHRENIKSAVVKQRGDEFALSMGASMFNPAPLPSATMIRNRQEQTKEECQLWSWTRDLQGKSSGRTAQFTWCLEQWKKPRSPYNKKKPHYCGTPIPELPYDGDGVSLVSCASVEWDVPKEKVRPSLEISWSLLLKASVKFVEIKNNGPFSKRRTDVSSVSVPISKRLTLSLP